MDNTTDKYIYTLEKTIDALQKEYPNFNLVDYNEVRKYFNLGIDTYVINILDFVDNKSLFNAYRNCFCKKCEDCEK